MEEYEAEIMKLDQPTLEYYPLSEETPYLQRNLSQLINDWQKVQKIVDQDMSEEHAKSVKEYEELVQGTEDAAKDEDEEMS